MGDDVNSLIDTFYKEHPETFTFPPNSEAPYSSALLQYLPTQPAFIQSGFSINDGGLISPFGDRMLLAIDSNGDGRILTNNYACASPWKDKRYSCALIRHATQSDVMNSPKWIRQN